MQASGCLRRPLWDIIKSIGVGRPHEQRTRLRIRRFAHTQATKRPQPSEEAAQADVAVRGPEPSARSAALEGSERWSFREGARKGVLVRPPNLSAQTRASADRPPQSPHRAAREQLFWQDVPPGEKQQRTHAPSPQQSEPRVRRVRAKIVQKEETVENTKSYFEAVIQSAIASPVDYKKLKYPALASDGKLRPRYFNAYGQAREHRLRKQLQRWTRQSEMYGINTARNWRSALELLDLATLDGESRHKRRMETVRIEGGLQAVWKIPTGEVILEVMQRTGAHLQTTSTPSGTTGPFQSVSLWGTPAQNEHATRLLVRYVEAADQRQQPVELYSMKTEVLQNSAETSAVFGATARDNANSALSHAREDMDGAEMELLEDALGDVTNAPTREPAPVRAVWSPSKVRIRGRPSLFNQLTFAAYVDALTAPVNRLARRKLYGVQSPRSTKGHVENMTAELVRLFTGRSTARYVSASAVDSAIGWFIKYNDFPAARKVFFALENQQFDFTASNFDVFFEVAAREESVPNFLYNLRLMISKGRRPTARSWTAFHLLMSRRFPLEVNIVAEAMRRKGLLSNTDTVKTIAAGNADRALAAHLSSGGSLDAFIDGCEARFGEPVLWLSTKFANKAANTLLARGRREDAVQIVRQAEALARTRGRKGINTHTMNTFMASCMRAGDVEGALAYIRLFMPPPPSHDNQPSPAEPPVGRFMHDPLSIRPDRVTYSILFGMAWHHRFYNVARVLWRHACAHGVIGFKTQDAVRRSLSCELLLYGSHGNEKWSRGTKNKTGKKQDEWPLSDNKIWNALAGKFVVGMQDGSQSAGSPPAKRADNTFRSHGAEDAEWNDALAYLADTAGKPYQALSSDAFHAPTVLDLAKLSRNDASRPRLARDVLNADLEETGSLRPVNSLLVDLERAWRLDELWRAEGLGYRQGARRLRYISNDESEGQQGPDKKLGLRDTMLKMLEEMLARGVKAPMRVGDAAGLREVEGLTDVLYKP